jgi:serine/threonine protein kinase
LKPSNILLDANYGSKLGDFGICRIICHDRSSSRLNNTTLCHITVPKGTLPYIDPEFLQTGVLTFKSDVYSFGAHITTVVDWETTLLDSKRSGRFLRCWKFESPVGSFGWRLANCCCSGVGSLGIEVL